MINNIQSRASSRSAHQNPMAQLMKNQAESPAIENAYGDTVILSSATERQNESCTEALFTAGCSAVLPEGM
jgi:hypothetical protein